MINYYDRTKMVDIWRPVRTRTLDHRQLWEMFDSIVALTGEQAEATRGDWNCTRFETETS